MLTESDFIKGLTDIFAKAKEKDEFELISLLLGYDGGMGDPRMLSHFYESERFFQELSILVQPNPSDLKNIRIGLLLYCHFFEMNELYRIIGNLLNIIKGQQYQIGLFSEYGEEGDSMYPHQKITSLKQMALGSGMEYFIDSFDVIYFNRLRNSLFHSDYSIVDDDYIFVSRKPILLDNVPHYALSISKFIMPLIQSTLKIATTFFNLLRTYKGGYTQTKLIKGRFPDWQPIVILGSPEKGLIGIETLSGSAVKLIEMGNAPFLAAFNIQITPKKAPSTHEKRLADLIKLNTYAKNDPELLSLEKEIIALNDPGLKKGLSIAFYNWGNNIREKAEAATNPKEKEHLLSISISKYDNSLAYNPDFAECIFNRALTLSSLSSLNNSQSIDRRDILAQFEKAIKIKPEMSEIYSPTGELLFNLAIEEGAKDISVKYLIRAAEVLKENISLNPNDKTGVYNIAIVYYTLLRFDQSNSKEYIASSKKYYENAIASDPNNIDYLLGYASLLEQSALVKKEEQVSYLYEANNVIEKVIKINSDLPRPHFKKGNNLFLISLEEGENREKLLLDAIAEFRQCVKLNNFSDEYLNNLGLALFHLADEYKNEKSEELFQEAVVILNEAIRLKPGKRESIINIGFCYYRLYKLSGNLEYQEKSIFNLVIAHELGMTEAIYQLLSINSYLKKKEESLKYLDLYIKDPSYNEKAIKNDPDMHFLLTLPEANEIILVHNS